MVERPIRVIEESGYYYIGGYHLASFGDMFDSDRNICCSKYYDPATLRNYIVKAPRSDIYAGVWLLSPELIAKANQPELQKDSVKSIELGRQLGVRAPCVKRIFECKRQFFVVMERINGEDLNECWHRLGWFTTLRLALQLREFVRRMRSRTSPTGGGLLSGEVESLWLEDYYRLPKNATAHAFAAFFNFWCNYVPPPLGEPVYTQKKRKHNFSSEESLVFTHQDLTPRNLMIDKDNQLWIVDWDFSGWYPTYFEYVAMQNFYYPQKWGWFDKLRWYLFSWISVGIYETKRRQLRFARSWFLSHRVARYYELLPEGADLDDFNLRRPGI